MIISEVADFLQPKLAIYLDMLRQMVNINSFTANPAGINQLGELTAGFFAPLGFGAEMIQSVNPRYGKHLVMSRPGRTPRTIGLITHLDTVFPPAEEIQNNFYWREEGDRIYGPGTNDIKGGTVMIYMVLDALCQLAPDTFNDINWVILADASEETDAEDFGQLCLERLGEKNTLAALIFEAGLITHNRQEAWIGVARKGMAIYQVTVEGKGSHAGAAHPLGANAIVQMAHTIQKIASFTDYGRHLTFNVGTVSGGTVVNRVPHLATALVEMRTFSPQVFQEGVAAMMTLPDQVVVKSHQHGYPCQVSVEIVRQTQPWPRNPATDRLFAAWEAAGRELNLEIKPEERGGLSDGNMFWHLLPTLDGLGPAGTNAHCSERSPDGSKEQEYVLQTSFVPKATLNILAILRLIQTI